MSKLSSIRVPVKEEMLKFEAYFNDNLKTDIPLLKIILNYVLRRKGKQMRPLLVFLSAGLNGTITESTHLAATFIELLHTATLVHDDVVDDSNERRGALSINALWNSKIAVLTGDFLLSQGLLISVRKNQYDMLEIMSSAVQAMSEGELLQLQKARKLDITEDIYFRIIRMKTATLISACTETGTKSVTNDSETIRKMKDLGENIGMAFQIRDDIFDYEDHGLTGKPAGNDIREKKITLPLIHALGQVEKREKKQILNIVGSKKKSAREVKKVVTFVLENGGLDYASEMMDKFRDKALAILDTYDDSQYKKSMAEFIYYTTSRHK
ncbi:MAG: polyprenyl synthetase family protein [Bacteroidales bacterium]|nr:polyprenyl synthetase family protein [Bacteroidales bacterium]